jgi:hypothetical protein
MTTPTIADYLKYANLQMAAEAFLVEEKTNEDGTKTYTLKENIKAALVEGNNRASRLKNKGVSVIYVLNGVKSYMKAWQGKSEMTLTLLIAPPLF